MKKSLLLFTALLPVMANASEDFSSLQSLGKGAEVMGGMICKSNGTVVLKEVERRSVWNTKKYYLLDESGNLLELSQAGSGAGDWSAELAEPNGTPVSLSLSPESASVNRSDEIVSKGTLNIGGNARNVICYGKTFLFI